MCKNKKDATSADGDFADNFRKEKEALDFLLKVCQDKT